MIVKVLEVVAVLKSPGRSYKKISLPKMPWDEEKSVQSTTEQAAISLRSPIHGEG